MENFEENKEIYSKRFTAINSKKFIHTKINSAKDFIDNITTLYRSKTENKFHIANSKLMQLTFVYELSKLKKQDVDKLITDMLFLAQKRGKGFGPFGKIY